MRRLGKILGRLPGASIANTTPEQLAKRSGAKMPELAASILMGTSPKSVVKVDRSASGVPVRIYTPDASRAASPGHPVRPLIVYLHGGGFVFGDLRGGDWMCGTVAKDLDAVVVSVDYRLAPKHPFAAAVDDCYATLLWAAEHAGEFGDDASKFSELYGGPSDDWRVSPLVAPSLARLPSTLIEVGGHDPLHDDGVV